MTRLIDAERLAELITELIPRHSREADYGRGRVDSYKFVLKVIANAPTVDVTPTVTSDAQDFKSEIFRMVSMGVYPEAIIEWVREQM